MRQWLGTLKNRYCQRSRKFSLTYIFVGRFFEGKISIIYQRVAILVFPKCAWVSDSTACSTICDSVFPWCAWVIGRCQESRQKQQHVSLVRLGYRAMHHSNPKKH